MNREQLREALSFLLNGGIELGFEMYLVLHSLEDPTLRMADLGDDGLMTDIKKGFIEHIKERTFDNDNAEVHPLTDFDTAPSTIHLYNLQEVADGLDIINQELDPERVDTFNFEEDSLSNIKGFLIKISSVDSHVVLYKHHSHLNLLTQRNGVFMIRNNERFMKPSNDQGILRFSFTMDFLKVNNQIIIYNLKCLENNFNFDQVVVNRALQQIDELEALDFVDNIEFLRDFARNRSGANKVLKLKPNSPVLGMQFEAIRDHVQNDMYLSRRFRFNDDNSKFHLHSQVSREYFIKLMNDDYLISDLSKTYYDSEKKNFMAEEEDKG